MRRDVVLLEKKKKREVAVCRGRNGLLLLLWIGELLMLPPSG